MKLQYNKFISLGALVALTGYILSGPVAFLVVKLIKPQPAWVSAAVFAENYSIIQDMPYYFGFLLIGGMLMLVAGHYLNCVEEDAQKKFHLLISLGCTIAFCTLIAFNYICQTTFVRNLALHFRPDYEPAVSAFSMSNPLSFAGPMKCGAMHFWALQPG